jgi:transcriptional regulator GlxA family with amidase domain
MRNLQNAVRSARSALGEAADALERAVAAEAEPDAKLAQLERAFLDLLVSVPKPKLLSRPIALEAMKAHGVTRISELQQNHRIQARQLERIFLEEIGVSAKIFCRIVRFNHAKSMIERNADVDLRQLAYECGYADQSHFTRNFRELFGRTPADFKALMKQAEALFRDQKRDVVFLQDEALQPG